MQDTVFTGLSQTDAAVKIGALCKSDMAKTSIRASVSAAQYILEPSYDKSGIAQKVNNCFGMKCFSSGNAWSGSIW